MITTINHVRLCALIVAVHVWVKRATISVNTYAVQRHVECTLSLPGSAVVWSLHIFLFEVCAGASQLAEIVFTLLKGPDHEEA